MDYLRKAIIFQSFRGVPSFSRGAGVNMLISIETYRTYDFLPEGC